MSKVFYVVIGCFLLAGCLLLTGCAALAGLSPTISAPSGGHPSPIEVHEQTTVALAKDNFILVRTNVVGQSSGFSLFGIITIVPATLSKATSRFYDQAGMETGTPQSLAHLIIERTSSFYILFGIPEVIVRADIVQFKPDHRSGP